MKNGRAFYFNNLEAPATTVDSEDFALKHTALPLSSVDEPRETPAGEDPKAVQIVPSAFSIEEQGAVASTYSGVLTNTLTGAIISPEKITTNCDASRCVHQAFYDLSNLASGRYDLAIDGETRHYYVSDELTGRNVFGIVDIYKDDSGGITIPTDYNPAYNTSNQQNFLLLFHPAWTRWKYVLLEKKPTAPVYIPRS